MVSPEIPKEPILTKSPEALLTPESLPGQTAGKIGMIKESIMPNIIPALQVAVGIGLIAFLFKRGIEGIVFGKNPLRPLGKEQ